MASWGHHFDSITAFFDAALNLKYGRNSMYTNLYRRLGVCHARVGPFRSDSRCALFTARVRAAEREFRAGLPAPARNPQSWDLARENGVGRLACIGCSRAATLLNPMLFFFASAFLESEPPTSKLGGSEFFANIRAKMVTPWQHPRKNGVTTATSAQKWGHHGNIRAKNTDDVVSLLSQLCGWDPPATSIWIGGYYP